MGKKNEWVSSKLKTNILSFGLDHSFDREIFMNEFTYWQLAFII